MCFWYWYFPLLSDFESPVICRCTGDALQRFLVAPDEPADRTQLRLQQLVANGCPDLTKHHTKRCEKDHPPNLFEDIPSLKQTCFRTWKWMVGRLVSFCDGFLAGAMLVSGSVMDLEMFGKYVYSGVDITYIYMDVRPSRSWSLSHLHVSNEKNWLIAVYRGLYYTALWGL